MLFNVYIFFLIASGVMMLVMGGLRLPYARRSRVLNFILGAAFVIYGLYLLLFFTGGHVFIFFYAFVLPILMAVRFFRERAAYRAYRVDAAGHPAGRQSLTPSGVRGGWRGDSTRTGEALGRRPGIATPSSPSPSPTSRMDARAGSSTPSAADQNPRPPAQGRRLEPPRAHPASRRLTS